MEMARSCEHVVVEPVHACAATFTDGHSVHYRVFWTRLSTYGEDGVE